MMNGPARSNPFFNFTSPVQQPLSSWRSPINMKMLSDTVFFSVRCSRAGIHSDCNTYPFQRITFHWHPYYKVSAWHILAAVLGGFNSSSHSCPSLLVHLAPQTEKVHPRDPWNEKFSLSFLKFLSNSIFTGEFRPPRLVSFRWQSKWVKLLMESAPACQSPHYIIKGQSVALVSKNPPANARDIRNTCLIPGLGRSPGGGHGNTLQYSCSENPKDGGAWWATVYRVTKSWTQLKQLTAQQ